MPPGNQSNGTFVRDGLLLIAALMCVSQMMEGHMPILVGVLLIGISILMRDRADTHVPKWIVYPLVAVALILMAFVGIIFLVAVLFPGK